MYKGIKLGLSYTSPVQEVAWEGEQDPRRYLLNMICLQALNVERVHGDFRSVLAFALSTALAFMHFTEAFIHSNFMHYNAFFSVFVFPGN